MSPEADEAPCGLLLIWTDVDHTVEDEFNDWYDREHLAERVDLPGFKNGRRYEALVGHPKYLAWYETESTKTLASAAYGSAQANPSQWTRRIMPRFRNVTRVTAEETATEGGGLGAAALTLRTTPAPGAEATLGARAALLVQDLIARPGVVSARAWKPSADDAATGSAEAQLRAGQERPPAWGLILEAVTPNAAAAALSAVNGEALLATAARAPVELGLYRLMLARGRF